jgi:hypothetical protein
MSDVEPEPVADLTDKDEGEIYSFLLGDVNRTNVNGYQTPHERRLAGLPDVEDFLEGKEETIPDDGNLFDDSTVQIGDGVCSVCGSPTFRPPGLTPSGRRKRTPKYCDLHDPKLRIQAEGPRFTAVESQLKRLQEELTDDIRLGGTLLGFGMPVAGYYALDNADEFATALLKLCKNNQRLLRVLHRAAQVAPIYTVAKDLGGFTYSMQVDMKRADPNNMVAQRLGVTKAYNAIYPENANVNGDMYNTYQPTAPPRYAGATQ